MTTARASRSQRVALTHPDKLMYPRDGFTKQQVADYYAAVAKPMLVALRGRPLAFEHWPKGVGGTRWFQQNIGAEAEPWMTLAETPASTSRRVVRHLVADDPDALRWLAQHAVLAIHMWSSRVGSLESPDWVVFDLDPGDEHGFEQTLGIAHALRAFLEQLDVPSVPKTSGQRGLHVFVPLAAGAHTHDEAVRWATSVGRRITAGLDDVTMERSKASRRGRLYFDCFQNGYGKTVVAPYSLRGVDGAPVSTPLAWSEVNRKLDPQRFTLATVPDRLAKVGDLFAAATRRGIRLPLVE